MRRRGGASLALWAVAWLGCAAMACSESVELKPAADAGADARADDAGADADKNPDATSGPPVDASADSPFTTNDAGRVVCDDHPCACDNGLDDDGDGLDDGHDPECTGPYDDDESSFATGIPGDNKDFCQDCFFDGNSGSGDDQCQYHVDCLYGSAPAMAGGSSCFDCEVSQQCVSFCEQRTPNGCDCFGCCDVRRPDGSTLSIFLASTCSLDAVEDEEACPRCVPSSDCHNDCGRCELCPGRSLDDLPDDCAKTPECGGAPTCADDAPCPSDLYCQQGCCGARVF